MEAQNKSTPETHEVTKTSPNLELLRTLHLQYSIQALGSQCMGQTPVVGI